MRTALDLLGSFAMLWAMWELRPRSSELRDIAQGVYFLTKD